ncbi:MAG: hypothetical protein R3229_12310 [Alphaproteobacteria bacterium]|nr:hypothetical protein [Alphaproteobacteria bacterium]
MTDASRQASPPPDLSPRVALGLPLWLLLGLVLFAAPIYDSAHYDLLIRSELGLIENGTAVLALAVTAYALHAWRFADVMAPPWAFRLWLGFFAVGGVVLAGEEISWGQHFFGWDTPDWIRERNIQRETNLHNLVHMAELAPKFVLHMAATFGGILWPLAVGRGWLRAPRIGGTLYWLMPTAACLPAAALAIAVRILERVLANAGLKERGISFKEFKELNELFLILFVVLYLASLATRARAAAGRGGSRSAQDRLR